MTNKGFRARAESLHAFVYRARLCVKWVYFQGRKIIILKITPTQLFEEPLKFIAYMSIFLDNFPTYMQDCYSH